MKTILHMGVSKDGYIAKSNGDSDWVSKVDEDLFLERVRKAKCVVIGKTTFDQYRGSIYPISNALNIILTSEAVMSMETGLIFASSPIKILKIAEEHGLNEMIVSGGAKTAESFLREGLLNEIFFTVHPIVLGEGIKLFELLSLEDYFDLKDTRDMGEGLVEMHYIKKD
jgi:dihydrofolate reductase